MKHKFKIGDIVEIIDIWKTYPSHTPLARSMGLKRYVNTAWYDVEVCITERVGIIISCNYDQFVYGVSTNKQDILISEDGIKKISKIKAELLK